MQLWTDYPILELGDAPKSLAPIREVRLVRYDGDKYATIEVNSVITTIKAGYLYISEGRFGEVLQAFKGTLQ